MLLQVTVVAVPSLAKIFNAVPLNSIQWINVGIISLLPIVIMEMQKKINSIKMGKKVYKADIMNVSE